MALSVENIILFSSYEKAMQKITLLIPFSFLCGVFLSVLILHPTYDNVHEISNGDYSSHWLISDDGILNISSNSKGIHEHHDVDGPINMHKKCVGDRTKIKSRIGNYVKTGTYNGNVTKTSDKIGNHVQTKTYKGDYMYNIDAIGNYVKSGTYRGDFAKTLDAVGNKVKIETYKGDYMYKMNATGNYDVIKTIQGDFTKIENVNGNHSVTEQFVGSFSSHKTYDHIPTIKITIQGRGGSRGLGACRAPRDLATEELHGQGARRWRWSRRY